MVKKEQIERGVIEFDVMTGVINWANEFVLRKMDYSLDALKKLKVFDIIPKQLQDRICDKKATIIGGREPSFLIWPSLTSDNSINWWYILEVENHHPIRRITCEFIQTTEVSGSTYIFMCIQMDITNRYNILNQKVYNLSQWTRNKARELSDKQDNIQQDLKQHLGAINKHTAEILKLIGSNVINDKRITSFEQHVKMTTNLAIKSITMQAGKAGKGMLWMITIPVFVTAALVTIVQYVVWHYL